MTHQHVPCGALVQQATVPYVIYHHQLGCFHSDWHQHAWGQLVYAERGSIYLHCRHQKRLVPSWYAVWIPPGTDQAIWSDSPQLFMRAICLPIDAGDELARSLAVFPVSTLLRELIRYTQRWSQAGPHDTAQVGPFLRVIQQLLPAAIGRALPICLPATTHPQLAPVVDYMQRQLSDPLSQSQLAARFGLSVRTLSRLFTRQLGTTFTAYWQTARILKALELIEAGHDNVSQLADAVGYETLAAFSNTFLAICGCRPSCFIRERKRETSYGVID